MDYNFGLKKSFPFTPTPPRAKNNVHKKFARIRTAPLAELAPNSAAATKNTPNEVIMQAQNIREPIPPKLIRAMLDESLSLQRYNCREHVQKNDASKREHAFLRKILNVAEKSDFEYYGQGSNLKTKDFFDQVVSNNMLFSNFGPENTATRKSFGLQFGSSNIVEARKSSTALALKLEEILEKSASCLRETLEEAKNEYFTNNNARPTLNIATTFMEEIKVWDVVLSEVNVQVSQRCKERGKVLQKSRERIFFILNFLNKVLRTQQMMITSFEERLEQTRPRTGTVDRQFRKVRRAHLGSIAAVQYTHHDREMKALVDRLDSLEDALKLGKANEIASLTDKSEADFQKAKSHFRSLLRSINSIEAESNRVKELFESDDVFGERAREVFDMHSRFLSEKKRRKQTEQRAATTVQKVWRGL